MWYFRIQILLLTGLSWFEVNESHIMTNVEGGLCVMKLFFFNFMDKSSSLELRYLLFLFYG